MKKFGEALVLCIGDLILFFMSIVLCFVFSPLFKNSFVGDQICFILGNIVAFTAFYFIYNNVGINLIKDCGFKLVKLDVIFKALLIGVVLQFISAFIGNFSINVLHISTLGYNDVQKAYNEMNKTWFGFFSIAICAPIMEEIFCRGIILRQFLRYLNPLVAIIMQSFIFGLLHMNSVQFIYTFIGGIFIGYVAYYTKSIVPCILVHFGLNSIGYLFDTDYILKLNYYQMILVILIVLLLYLIYSLKEKKIDNGIENC